MIKKIALIIVLNLDFGLFGADIHLQEQTAQLLIQVAGRAARNVDGKVILYADKVTKSIDKAIKETDRRRNKQLEYNKKNKISVNFRIIISF